MFKFVGNVDGFSEFAEYDNGKVAGTQNAVYKIKMLAQFYDGEVLGIEGQQSKYNHLKNPIAAFSIFKETFSSDSMIIGTPYMEEPNGAIIG